ncbi:MAG: molybdopterin molybdotransferase MoeA [Clostridiales bacterium]
MKIDFLNVVSLKKATNIVKGLTNEYTRYQDMYINESLVNSLGKIVYETILSNIEIPEYNRSTVDGYAIRVSDIQGAADSSPGILRIIGEVTMGNIPNMELIEGTCIYVPTGGAIPKGSDSMVMIEDTQKLDEETLLIYKQVKYGMHISYRGDDIKKGDILIQAGKKITPYDIALLSGAGISKIKVTKEPIFTVLSTGDEIADLNDVCKVGMVRDINGYGISAWISENGGKVKRKEIIKDNFNSLQETLEKSLEDSDFIVLSGGSSLGIRDYTKSLIESFSDGKVIFHGLDVQPGKPTLVGLIGKKIIFGLPGHPAAALLICQKLVGAAMEKWFQIEQEKLLIEAIITENIHGTPGRDKFQMVKITRDNNQYIAKPIYGKSALISTLVQATGWIKISKEMEGVFSGDKVFVELLQEVRY